VIFSVLLLAKGANPVDAMLAMLESTFTQQRRSSEIFIKASPLVLAALAVTVPARAGLVNVGGEGQLIIGGVARPACSCWSAEHRRTGRAAVPAAGRRASAGAVWAGLAGAAAALVGINEAVSTLLLNYVALDVMLFLIYDRGRRERLRPAGDRELPVDDRQASAARHQRVHAGIVLAVVATVVVYLVLNHTRWGFRLGWSGGNPEAARRRA
jgi:ABC-type uncharacterized transport system permease subunit